MFSCLIPLHPNDVFILVHFLFASSHGKPTEDARTDVYDLGILKNLTLQSALKEEVTCMSDPSAEAAAAR